MHEQHIPLFQFSKYALRTLSFIFSSHEILMNEKFEKPQMKKLKTANEEIESGNEKKLKSHKWRKKMRITNEEVEKPQMKIEKSEFVKS